MSGNLSSDNRGKGQQPSTGSEAASIGSSVGDDARVSAREAQLTKAGFSVEQIATIREKVADLNVKIIEPMAGDTISGTAADAVALRKQTGSAVVFKFNNALMIVGKGDTAKSVCDAYEAHCEAASKAYWTPERIAEKNAKEARDNASLAKHMGTLSSIDFKDPVAPLKWLCKLEEVGGMTYSTFDRKAVLDAFSKAGYTAGMNVGDKFNSKDQENYKGYIIGQALDGIATVGCPHQVLHTFTERYQKEFSLT